MLYNVVNLTFVATIGKICAFAQKDNFESSRETKKLYEESKALVLSDTTFKTAPVRNIILLSQHEEYVYSRL